MSIAFTEHDVAVWQGDALEQLTLMPAGSVQCAVTSPPYFGLRDYGTGRWEGGDPACPHAFGAAHRDQSGGLGTGATGTRGAQGYNAAGVKPERACCSRCGAHRVDEQLGLESSPAEYVARMVAVFAEVRRVLAADGVLWCNLGDSYSASTRSDNRTPTARSSKSTLGPKRDGLGGQNAAHTAVSFTPRHTLMDVPAKNLLGMPWMVARALQQPRYVGKITNEADRAWLAGWIDGEGTISYTERDRGADHTSTHDVRVFVTNCDDGPLRQFADICGGRVNIHDDGTRDNRYGKRICYRWQMGTHDSAMVLREVYPYLRTKRRQAALIWSLFTTLRHQNGHARTPAAVVAKRREIAAMVRTLNAGGDVTLPEWVEEPPPPTEPGWILRNAVVWHKPNAMPESVTDRLSTRYELVFLFSRSRRYWFDLDAIREPTVTPNEPRPIGGRNLTPRHLTATDNTGWKDHDVTANERGRNPGDVWNIPTSAFPGAHFACMPPALAERCIKAGCPPGGTVLDPFAGSGTTLAAARKLGRKSVGIELNPDYIDLIRARIGQAPLEFEAATSPVVEPCVVQDGLDLGDGWPA